MRREGTSIQRREGRPARSEERESELCLLFLYVSLSLGLSYVNWASQELLFVLPKVLTPILGPSFVLFSRAFPFLVFQPPPFWTPFPYSAYLTDLLMVNKNNN